MKKVVLGLIVLSSLGFCNDNWKNELDVKKGILNSLSKETSKFFCEHENMEKLDIEMLEFFKKQDPIYYKANKEKVDALPELLIVSTLSQGQSCEEGFIVSGSCGEWVCIKEPKKEQ